MNPDENPAPLPEIATLPPTVLVMRPPPALLGPAGRAPEQPGTWIARYRLVEKLGEGGFGTVWRAVQQEPIHREVALKVIKPGMDSAEIAARFAAERQALALMDHPNIATVLDAGATEDGRPFFAMELVRGQPITAFCDENQLTVRQRLELFLPVCQAVQHAHQKGILHRDLKPSNILVEEVDAAAVPKVIDFGIAKALGAGLAPQFDETLARTREGMVIGTPQYMSPEQAGSRPDVDTRSDIYTLGAILYELLTGSPPLTRETLRQAGWEEMLRLVREEEVRRPSSRLLPATEAITTLADRRRTTARRLGETVRGELDWILLKALDKDRERRYASATALAEDLQRYLRDEPVHASPPGRGYLLRKFLRRHKGPVAAAAAIFLCILAGLLTTLWMYGRERAAAREAGEQSARAIIESEVTAGVSSFLADDVMRQAGSAAQAERGFAPVADLTVREALQRAAECIGTRFEQRPLVEAGIRHAIGAGLLASGDASAGLEQARLAREVRTRLLGANARAALESATNEIGALMMLGRYAEALPLARDCLTRIRALPDPSLEELSRGLSNLAYVLEETADEAAAAALRDELFALTESRTGGSLQAPQMRSVLSSKASRLYAGRDYAGAEEIYRRLLSAVSQTGGITPEADRIRAGLARTLAKKGEDEQALALMREVVNARLKSEGPRHPATLLAQSNLATFLRESQPAEAGELFERVLKSRSEILGAGHPDTLATAQNYSDFLRQMERYEEAVALLRETGQRLEAFRGPTHVRTLEVRHKLSQTLKAAGREEESAALLRETLELQRRHLGPTHESTLISLHDFTVSEIEAGRAAAVLLELQELTSLRAQLLGAAHPDTLRSRRNYALALSKAGRKPEALAESEALAALCQKELPASHPEQTEALANLALTLRENGRRQEALAAFKEVMERRERAAPGSSDTLTAIKNYTVVLEDAGRHEDVHAIREKHFAGCQKKYGPQHRETLRSQRLLAESCWRVKLFERGAELSRARLALLREAASLNEPAIAESTSILGQCLIALGRWEEALPPLKEWVEYKTTKEPDDWKRHGAESILGRTLLALKRIEEAEPLLVRSLAGLRGHAARLPDQGREQLILALTPLVELYRTKGDEAKARECEAELKELGAPPDAR